MDLNEAFIRAKQRLAQRHGASAPSSDDRLPPGQYLTEKMPVLSISLRPPPIDLANWSLEVGGEVSNPRTFDWEQFQSLKKTDQTSDFHCVTRWSKYDVRWSGVRWIDLMEAVRPTEKAKYALFACADNYTTNIPMGELMRENVLLADTLEGKPLPAEHGGPMRLVVPQLYGWKSAKFVIGIRLAATDEPGFWETRGYNNHADPWKEERYS